MPRTSVVIPSYNHEKYVAECIQSVLGQTFQDFEIVVVDDGSSDATVERIRSIHDPRLHLFVSESNRGQFSAMEEGVRQARGEFIAVLNSDDAFHPEKLDKQVRFMDGHPEVGAVFTGVQLIGEDGQAFTDEKHHLHGLFKTENRSRQEWMNYFFYRGVCVSHPSMMVRKSCHEVLGHYKKHLAQWSDLDFILRILTRYEMHIIPEKLTKFRVRSGEANTGGNRPEARIRGMWEYGRVLRFYLTLTDLDDFEQVFPLARSRFGELDARLIGFYVGQLALEHENPVYKHFGISVLFDVFDDPELATLATERTGFTPLQLSALAKQEPYLSAFEERQQLREALQGKLKSSELLRELARKCTPKGMRRFFWGIEFGRRPG
jgi:glycosyltransferase involved in cell wall biosynthesis